MAGKLFYFLFILCTCGSANSLKLKQVLILSRHNLRTPIGERLQTLTPKSWLKWDQEQAQLTSKGALLEGYLSEYFSQWLKHHGLITQECPDQDSIHVYANTRQRTRDTAKAFVNVAFRNCNIAVISRNSTEMDPTFNPIIHNTTEAFREQVYAEMNKKLKEIDLKSVYSELNRISDIKNSEICREKSYCDMVNDTNDIVYEVGTEPDVAGPLYISNAMVDAFLMAYYEGFPLKDIAWGEIETEDQLESFVKVLKDYQNTRFNLPKSSKDFAKPLLYYIKEILSSDKKFTLLVGHDSNLNSVIASLGFKLFTLPGQFEISPIGAKLVFQRWSDEDSDFLKVEYVYGSLSQIRNAEKLSLVNPPKNVTMHFASLVTNENGFYSWSDFERILQVITN